jgi:hypothetical protein
VSAIFIAPDYTVTTAAVPLAGGTTAVVGGSGASGTFAGNSSVTVTATANAGYTFRNWEENGTQQAITPSYTFALTASRNLVANFTANVTAPATPFGLVATALGTTVALSWSATNNLATIFFRIERAASPSGPFTIRDVSASARNLIPDTPPGPGTWYYQVRECSNAGGCSAPSNVANVSL